MSKGKKKSLFERAIDALTNRDEREAAEADRAEALADAARKEADARARIATEKAAAERAAADQQAEVKTTAARVATDRVQAAGERAITESSPQPAKGVVTVRSLRIRADHSTTAEVVGGLLKGDEVTIISTWSDGTDTWAQLDRGWAAMVYRGETYIEPA